MMTRAERRAWRAPTSLDELGRVVAEWLTGRLASQPGYQPGYGPDPETTPLIPVLAAANRAGFVTSCSQPGVTESPGHDGAMWAQRAAVTGWLDHEALTLLLPHVHRSGLLTVVHDTADPPAPRPDTIPVTTRNRQPMTSVGRPHSRRSITNSFAECSTAVTDALCNTPQVSLVAPQWGPDDLLWRVLSEWATSVE